MRICSSPECQTKHYAKGYCYKHWSRLHRHGTTDLAVSGVGHWMSLRDRLLSQSIPEPNTGCWLWLGKLDRKGYAKVWRDGKEVVASRASYETFNGPLPDGANALHACDNPPCINPAHLFPGSNMDNIADRMRKGRGWRTHQLPTGVARKGRRFYAATTHDRRRIYLGAFSTAEEAAAAVADYNRARLSGAA